MLQLSESNYLNVAARQLKYKCMPWNDFLTSWTKHGIGEVTTKTADSSEVTTKIEEAHFSYNKEGLRDWVNLAHELRSHGISPSTLT